MSAHEERLARESKLPRPEGEGIDANLEVDVCRDCGCEDHGDQCPWCRADEMGRPWGTCRFCLGAKASNGTCACYPRWP